MRWIVEGVERDGGDCLLTQPAQQRLRLAEQFVTIGDDVGGIEQAPFRQA
jgi:hypothetical protein